MNIKTTLYTGTFAIDVTEQNTKMILFQQGNHNITNNHPLSYPSAIKKYLEDLFAIDFENDKSIMSFLGKYGLLVNANELTNATGIVEMPVSFLKYHQQLIQNILALNSDIRFPQKTDIFYIEKITSEFFSLLFQPYLCEHMNAKINTMNIKHELSIYFKDYVGQWSLTFFTEFFHFYSQLLQEEPIEDIIIDYVNLCKQLIEYPYPLIKINAEGFYKYLTVYIFRFVTKKNFDDIATTDKEELFKNIYNTITTIPINNFRLAKLLFSYIKYFDISCTDELMLSFKLKNNQSAKICEKYFKFLFPICQSLIADTINIYTKNIDGKLEIIDINKINPNKEVMYEMNFYSYSMLHTVFFQLANLLNKYVISECQYCKCHNIVFSSINRVSAGKYTKCCCHNHLTNYLSSQRTKNKRAKNSR